MGTFTGTAGNDTIIFDEGVDTIFGLGGDDIIEAGFSEDTVYGGSGDDIIRVRDGQFGDNVFGGTGKDTLDLSNSAYDTGGGVFAGFVVDMTVNEYRFDPNVVGAGGIYQMVSIERVLGSQQNDTIRGDSSFENLVGNAGNDTIFGGDGNDVLIGGAGDDSLYGGAGVDIVRAGAGADRVFITTPSDLGAGEEYNGGSSGIDNDILLIDSTTLGVDDTELFDLRGATLLNFEKFEVDATGPGTGIIEVQINASQIIAGLSPQGEIDNDFTSTDEAAILKIFMDVATLDMREIFVDDFNDDDGHVSVIGSNGNDTFFAGLRNQSDSAAYTISGRGGDDILHGADDGDRILGNDGNDMIYGRAGDDTAVGGLGNDRLYGQQGNDKLVGLDGDDVIYGANDSDFLGGQQGTDKLYGGSGDDIVIGGLGKDFLFGGAGFDSFRFAIIGDSADGATTRDVIRDFELNIDVIDLDPIDARSNIPGNQDFTFIGGAGFTGAGGEVRIQNAGTGTLVQMDINPGNPGAEMEIFVFGVQGLDATEFLF